MCYREYDDLYPLNPILLEKLVLGIFKEADKPHRIRRLAAANTSSAGINLTSPRSYLAMRSAISASQAA